MATPSGQGKDAAVVRAAAYPPLRSVQDVEAIERLPLDAYLECADFAELLRRGALPDPDKPAIHYIENADAAAAPDTLSYAALHAHARQVAALFRDMGISRTDPVALILPTLPELYMSLLAAFWTGIAFPVNWMLRPQNMLHLLGTARAKVAVALGPTPGFTVWEGLQSIAADLPGTTFLSVPGPGGTRLAQSDLMTRAARYDRHDATAATNGPDDVAAYIHSGGTTGLPKIVQLTHRGLAYRRWATNVTLATAGDEVIFADNPFSHVGGLMRGFGHPLTQGATAVIPGPLGARDKRFLANYWKLVDRYGVTRLSGVPTTLSVLIKNPPRGENISSFRPHFATGSTPVPVAVHRKIEEITGVRPLIMYGMTENSGNLTLDPRDGPTKYGSAGIRLPYMNIRSVVLGDDGAIARDCAPDETGMIVYRGPGVTPGYLDSRLNEQAFTRDGWFISGDLGRLDTDGYVWITGRAKDLIIRGGHNIDPALIEEALQQSADVLLVAAVAKPDPHAGEVPVAYVQLVPGSKATAAELLAFAAAHVAERPAAPKDIYIVEQMPLTEVGKPRKAQMRHDAARRGIGEALAGVVGGRDVGVEVGAGESADTIATITLPALPAADLETLKAEVDAAMRQFTLPYRIVAPQA